MSPSPTFVKHADTERILAMTGKRRQKNRFLTGDVEEYVAPIASHRRTERFTKDFSMAVKNAQGVGNGERCILSDAHVGVFFQGRLSPISETSIILILASIFLKEAHYS